MIVSLWIYKKKGKSKQKGEDFDQSEWTERRRPVYQRDRRKWKTSFSRLFGKPRQQLTANDSVQKTDAYRQITWRIILQPDFTQSHNYKDFDETSATQYFVTHRTAYVTKTDTLNVFFTKITTTLTLLDETFTDLLKLTQRTGTQHLLLQWLHLTLRALLRLSNGSYSPTTSV